MSAGWIGVDLDGTLAEYHGWNGGAIGAPIPAMVSRVLAWHNGGREVRIFTARVASGQREEQLPLIEAWCQEHLGRVLPVTHEKDFEMIELWDDRCVQVVTNTGQRADVGAAAERTRLLGIAEDREFVESASASVHQSYLDTCRTLGWPVKPENLVPYADLGEDSKELDRASVRAALREFIRRAKEGT